MVPGDSHSVVIAHGSNSLSIPASKTFCNCRKLDINTCMFRKAESCSYNIPESARHFRTPLARFELLEEVTGRLFFADLCEPFALNESHGAGQGKGKSLDASGDGPTGGEAVFIMGVLRYVQAKLLRGMRRKVAAA